MAQIYLSIGSNIEPEINLQACAKNLADHFTSPIWSPVYRSAAVGMEGDDFLNAVVVAHTMQTVESVNNTLKLIEDNHGRIRSANKFTSRTLDIDLLLYDMTEINLPNLTVPSQEITTALHVLKPLTDVAPLGVHPLTGIAYSSLLEELLKQQPSAANSLSEVPMNFA